MNGRTITRTETSRSEWRFVARRNGKVIAETRDYDVALRAFYAVERPTVTLHTCNRSEQR